MAVVVLPTPPFWLATAITRAMVARQSTLRGWRGAMPQFGAIVPRGTLCLLLEVPRGTIGESVYYSDTATVDEPRRRPAGARRATEDLAIRDRSAEFPHC